MNKKLSVVKYNTPFEIEQQIFSRLTTICVENFQNQNQCFYCLGWFDVLPLWMPFLTGIAEGMTVGFRESCEKIAEALQPEQYDEFKRKVGANLLDAFKVDWKVLSEVKR